MKKKIVSAVLIFCAFVLLPGLAAAGVSGQKHDLSYLSGNLFSSTNESEVCIFCHTPHGAIVTDPNNSSYRVPLWNRSLNPSATYAMYNSNTMIASDVPTAPTGVSLLCMSCHDGVSAMEVLVNYGSNASITFSGGRNQLADITGPSGFISANIGELPNNAGATAQRNLSNDHPISFTYNSTLAGNSNGALNDPGANGANITPLKLFNYGAKNEVLECATCHDPHTEGIEGVFLRMSNDSSLMCLKCHNK